jgi:hypothetical protein
VSEEAKAGRSVCATDEKFDWQASRNPNKNNPKPQIIIFQPNIFYLPRKLSLSPQMSSTPKQAGLFTDLSRKTTK